MEAPKITLSDAEQFLIADASWILTKNSVVAKICHLFGELGNGFYAHCQPIIHQFPAIFTLHPKLSKGEKHKDLPWVMLDYPRHFGNDGHVAIRCFFWWGNYFSIQLQVSGVYLAHFLPLVPVWQANSSTHWITGLTKNPWDMEIPAQDWQTIHPSESVDGYYLKVAKKIPINEWESLPEKFRQYFTEMAMLIADGLKHQSGETTL